MAWVAVFGFLLFGNWEWLQTPFYDNDGLSLTTVVWYRLHCTAVDVLILIACVAATGLLVRNLGWLQHPQPRHLAILALLGTSYTGLSEQINVSIRGSWAYSSLMPVVPGTSVGVVPLAQWLVLPALAVWLASRHRG